MKEIKDFIERLKTERNELNQKLKFVREHKFTKEEQFLSDQVSVINSIMYELELVCDGKQKGNDSKFMF